MSQLLGVKEGSRANGSLLIIHRFCISSPEIAHSISYLYDIFSTCAYYIRDSLSSEIVETAVMGSNQVHPYPPYSVASFFLKFFFLSSVIKIRSFCPISSSQLCAEISLQALGTACHSSGCTGRCVYKLVLCCSFSHKDPRVENPIM